MFKKREKMLLRSLSFIFLCVGSLFIGAVTTSAEKNHSARISNEMTYILNYSDGTQVESEKINANMPHDIVNLENISIVIKSTVVEVPAANWMDPYGDFFNLSSNEYGSETRYFSFESLPEIITNMNKDYFTMEYSKDGILYSKKAPQVSELKSFRVKPRNTTEILPVGEELLLNFDMKLDTDQLIKSNLLANKTEENPFGNVFYPFAGGGNWTLSQRFPISFTGETKVTVNYIEMDSKDAISESDTIKGIVGKDYETTEKAIDGYEFVKVDGESKGVFDKKDKEITYFYKKKEPVKSVVTVEYVDESGKELAKEESQTGEVGRPYTTEPKEIPGYELIELPKNQSGLFLEENIEVVYEYKAVKEQEIYVHQEIGSVRKDVDGKVWVSKGHSNYQFRLNKNNPNFTVSSDEELKNETPLYPGTTPYTYYGYSIEYKDNSYELIKDRSLVYEDLMAREKEIGKEINLVTIYYGPTSTIKVNYNLIKEDGTKNTLFSEKEYGKFDIAFPDLFDVSGESIPLNKVVNDYIPINLDIPKQVKFIEDNQVIDIDFRLPKITVKYQDTLGKTLKESQVSYGKIKDVLNISVPQIDGYDYTNNINKEISYIGEDQEVTLIYAPKIEGTVTVKYVDESGKELAKEESQTGEVGKPYETEPKKIEGYELIKLPKNQSGLFSEDKIEVTYEYRDIMNQEISVIQKLGSVIENGDAFENGPISNWQFTLGLENPEFTVFNDETLKQEKPLRPRKSPYTYYGYSIRYDDNSYELRQDRTLNFNELKQHEKDAGKRISLITIVYGPTSTIKVNYNLINEEGIRKTLLSEEKYGKFDVAYPNLFDVTGESFSLNTVFKDYIPINFEVNKEIKFTNDDQEIDLDFRLPKITVKYQDTLGKNLKESQVSYGKIKDVLNISVPQIDGYDYTNNINKEISYIGEDQEVTLIYAPKIEGTVTARYMDELGKEIAQRVTITNYVGEEYHTLAKDIPGYELLLTPDNASGSYQEGVTTVDYIYHQNTVNPDIEGQVIVKYVDENNEEIASRTELSGHVGEAYQTSAKPISGYELISEPEMSGIYTEGVTELVYQYKSTNSPVDVEGKVLVNYVDEKGQSIAAPVELTGKVDSRYQTSAKAISGYTLKSDSGNTAGIFVEGIQQVTYIYEKTDDVKPEIEGFVTVYYVDSNQKELAERISLSGTVGSEYGAQAKEISGYELKEIPANANGFYSEGNQDVVYMYQKKDIPEPVIEGNIITKYVTEDGKEIALSESITGKIGSEYQTKAKAILGFELSKEPDNKTGQFVEGTVTVTYVYKQTKTEELVEGKVIVKYVDTRGKEIALSDTMSGKLKEAYTTTPKEIPGYKLIEEPKNKIGTYVEGSTTVTYVYKENEIKEKNEGKVSSKFINQEGNAIAEEVITTGKVGDSYQTSKKLIPGYDFVKIEGKESGTYTEGVQEVVYVYKKANKPSIIKPISPVTPTKQVTPKVPAITGGGSSISVPTSPSKVLPKTGEIKNIYLSIIGLVLSVGMYFIFQKKLKRMN